MKTYRVNEMFYTLQGEGYWTGAPAVFIRFSGCNLRCDFCDTDFAEYREMTSAEILAEAIRLVNVPRKEYEVFIVLTGGEPALQVDDELLEELHKVFSFITIETNGTRKLPEGIEWVTLSPKENTEIQLDHADEIKVVYVGQDVEKYHYMNLGAECLFLQPCSQKNTREVIDYIMQHPWWRLSLQTHKIIGIK